MELYEIIKKVVAEGIIKLTISKPRATAQFKKITVSKKDSDYFAEQFTEKQVFHKNINRIAKKYGLKVIYDSAHAFGVEYKGKGIVGVSGRNSCRLFTA